MTVEAKELRRDVNREVIQAWLDALATGACDEQAFLNAVQKLARKSAEAGWDSLSLVDQYYRRGRLAPELFNSLRARLGSQLVGQSEDPEMSVPLPQRDENPTEEYSVPTAPPPRSQPATTVKLQSQAPRPAPSAAPPAESRAPSPDAGSQPVERAKPSPPSARPPDRPKVVAETTPVQVESWTPSEPQGRGRDLPLTLPNANARDSKRRVNRRDIGVGDLLRGRYQIKSILGKGGTGMVFEAVDLYRIDMPDAGQRVALKVLHTQVSDRSDLMSELQREFQLLQSLSHPNIVRVHDYDRDGELAFLTMEYLRGLSLFGLMSARNHAPLVRAYSFAIIRDVGAALTHAHSKGVVHGDLNPGNIFITNEGDVRVLDFGAAHSPSEGPVVSPSESEGMPIATPRYASVQVLEGKRPDVRDDIYALACIAYLLLSGKHPFGERTALAAQAEKQKPARPSGLTHKEWQALKTGLAFDRERRPSNVEEWLHSFEWRKAAGRLPVLLALVRVSPQKRRSSLWPALGVAAAVLIAVGLWIRPGSNKAVPPQASAPESEQAASSVPESQQQSGETAPAERSASSPTRPAPAVQAEAQTPSTTAPGTPSHALPTPRAVEAPGAPASSAAPPAASIRAPSPPPAASTTAGTAASAPLTETAPPPRRASTTPAANNEVANAAAGASDAAEGSVPIRSRIELAADTIDVPITDPAARVIVRRKGSLHGEVTFTWWTESGTAKPGQDFMAVAPHPEIIEDGKNAVSLFIPVVGDSTRRQPKSFYVVINDPSPGVALGARTLTMVTIPPSD
jgi:serine/threonine protein kinase